VILLVGSSALAAWQHSENQRLVKENESLKTQLDTQAAQLQTLEQEKQQQQTQLDQTQKQLKELETKNAKLEAEIQNQTKEIEKLREQLNLKNYITIGLTFLWSPSVEVDQNMIAYGIRVLNSEWNQARVYYFLYHANAASFIPEYADLCSLDQWINRAKALYPGPDIPITIIANTNSHWAGCASKGQSGVALIHGAEYDTTLLTHELLHNFGFGEEVLQHQAVTPIPSTYYARIQNAARQYQMPIPSDETS
jgi:hypothetical protein